jgi:hypothetical protein
MLTSLTFKDVHGCCYIKVFESEKAFFSGFVSEWKLSICRFSGEPEVPRPAFLLGITISVFNTTMRLQLSCIV